MRPLQARGKITAFKSTNRPEAGSAARGAGAAAVQGEPLISRGLQQRPVDVLLPLGAGAPHTGDRGLLERSPNPDVPLETCASPPLPEESR